MKIIRNKVFEVNSSSCHSISVSDNQATYAQIHLNDEGVFYIGSDDFGWAIDEHTDYSIKCSYLAIYIRDWSGDKLKELKDVYEECIRKYTLCSKIQYEENFWKKELKYYGDGESYLVSLGEGYIDHQSVEDQDYHYLFDISHPDYIEGELKDFLFNNNSVLITDNDNH